MRVSRFPFTGARRDLLSAECKSDYGKYREGHKVLPDNFEADTVWSQAFLRRLMQGESIERPVTISGPGLFTPRLVETKHAKLMDKDTFQAAVKREKLATFSKLTLAAAGSTIDLCSPPRPKRGKFDEATPAATVGGSSSSRPGPSVDLAEAPPGQEVERAGEGEDVFNFAAQGLD